ncbi:Hybrid peroxiredoxin hyPrx5 [Oceanibacterium hippocampi]|uniref:Glutathione-dependent peroxiredoxin n=1 Tax=Oceanibacterium hippocampi TaxID=745714 RepID=A0A1Y5TV54_9PROT|nr:peroxiredoxin [Oceanibacterium hippocampi]SLN68847.1 Hybrid peroxiredoxin hyPrx5 [Oceanibacterium hippocampi]
MKTIGDRVPDVTFRTRANGEWKNVTTADLFAGKTVVLFALPGAFTPTCSSTHLPGYLTRGDALREAGVDEILCLSVNDSFVMNAWAKDQGIDDEIVMVPDGNGEFSEGMGMLVDKQDLGFGKRSWRYSMLVRDGVIEKIFAEDRNAAGDPFKVSDVETMLGYLKGKKAAA